MYPNNETVYVTTQQQAQPVYVQPGYGQPMANPGMPGVVVQINQQGPMGWEVGPYKNELCGCFDDCPTCLMSYFCPCVQFGQNYEQINRDGCLVQGLLFAVLLYLGVPCIIHMMFRKQVRSKFNIPGDDFNDCLITWCCGCCALAQDAREIAYRQQEAAQRGIPF